MRSSSTSQGHALSVTQRAVCCFWHFVLSISITDVCTGSCVVTFALVAAAAAAVARAIGACCTYTWTVDLAVVRTSIFCTALGVLTAPSLQETLSSRPAINSLYRLYVATVPRLLLHCACRPFFQATAVPSEIQTVQYSTHGKATHRYNKHIEL